VTCQYPGNQRPIGTATRKVAPPNNLPGDEIVPDLADPPNDAPPTASRQLSMVIPVFNESESLKQLHDELAQVAAERCYPMEMIFVDDGSSDDSWSVIESLAAEDPRVHGIKLRRNFGKAAALTAGFDAATGAIVFTLDADLQDDPREIPRFLERLDEGVDVVSGWKRVRHDPWHKVGPSRVFNWLVGRMTGVHLHDHNCGFKCYRREIFHEVRLYGEMHRFVPVLAAARGWRVGEITVNHRRRQFGHSKYGATRIVKGFLDLLTVHFLTDFGQRPQHLIGTFGLGSFLMGGMGIAAMSIWWAVSRASEAIPVLHLHERALFYYSIVAVLLGAQLLAISFLAALVTAHYERETTTYSVAQSTGSTPKAEQGNEMLKQQTNPHDEDDGSE